MTDSAELATLLAGAWRAGGALGAIAAENLPQDRAQAYRIQDRMAELLATPVAGWKVGATSAGIQHDEGYDGPVPGRIFAERLVASGAQVPADLCPRSKLELEIAFRAKAELAGSYEPDPANLDEHFEMLLAFDLTSSRYAAATLPEDPLTRLYAGIADNGNGGYVVTGPSLGPIGNFALTNFALSIVINGDERGEPLPPGHRSDPLYSLGWVLTMCRERNLPVCAGDLILTGSANRPIPLEAEAEITATAAGGNKITVVYA